MSKKEEHIQRLLEMAGVESGGTAAPPYQAGGMSSASPYYLAYFALFNRQRFYEAHDVLEYLWLQERNGPNNNFYKALIQLAGAFVHVQKGRVKPALALLRLSRSYLQSYAPRNEGLDISELTGLIDNWIARLSPERQIPESLTANAPKLAISQ